MKRILIVLIIFSLFAHVKAQVTETGNTSPKVKNTVYASVGGPGIYFSLLYERQLYIRNKYSLGVKGGIGTAFSSVLFPHEFNFPIGVFFLYGKRNSRLDISLNMTNYLLEQYDYQKDQNTKELKLLLVPSVAYRFQKPDGGLVVRAGFSPVVNINSTTNTISPWFDIGVGWAF
jgi:hypothetical protein